MARKCTHPFHTKPSANVGKGNNVVAKRKGIKKKKPLHECPRCGGRGVLKKQQQARKSRRRVPPNNLFPLFFSHVAKRMSDKKLSTGMPGNEIMKIAGACWRCLTPDQKEDFAVKNNRHGYRAVKECGANTSMTPPPCNTMDPGIWVKHAHSSQVSSCLGPSVEVINPDMSQFDSIVFKPAGPFP